ncbi:uncharacterized protein LOC112686898 isoform X2 [Sipha flava]|nr:uncharacterized protein LOC112686898 isoform X2 [Sipha flava]
MSKVTFICIVVQLLMVSYLADTAQISTISPVTTTANLDSTTSQTVLEVGTDTSILVTVKEILKQLKNAFWAIKRLSSDPKQIGRSISTGMCSSVESTYSGILSAALKLILEQLIAEMKEELSVTQIAELPNYKNTFDEQNEISEFKLKGLTLKGLENIIITQYIIDFCGLASTVEMYVPTLEITSSYTLKGNVNGSPISGDGILNASITMMGLFMQTNMECNAMLLSNDVCELAVKNKTVDWSAEKMMVNLSNIKYKDLSESQINIELNEFIRNYLKTNRVFLIQAITDFIDQYKKNSKTHQSPALFLKDLELGLKQIPIEMDKKQRSLQMNNANTLNMFVSLFVNPVL